MTGTISQVLLKLTELDAIVSGDVRVVFRRWRRPTVKPGGRLRTARGELAIDSVTVVDPATLTDAEAREAGFEAVDALHEFLFAPRTSTRTRAARPDESSQVYRVVVRYLGADPRTTLRNTLPSDAELAELLLRVHNFDVRSTRGPWAVTALNLISQWPGRRAPELAELVGWETAPWKANIRKLKELGLTESLPVGYQLSPRGRTVHAALQLGEGWAPPRDSPE